MKISNGWIVIVFLVFFVMNFVTPGFGEEAPGIKSKEIQQLRPNAAQKMESMPAALAGPSDLAVIDFFVDNNCKVKFTLQNRGGSFSSTNNSMQIDLCFSSGGCLNYSVGVSGLKLRGSKETFQVPAAIQSLLHAGASKQPLTIKIDPVTWLNIPDNPSNNSLSKNFQCLQQ